MADARIEGLSADGRFAHAYGAVLGSATIIVRSEGLRVTGPEHHKKTLSAAGEILGEAYRDRMRYFDRCRVKRNNVTYDTAGMISETEVCELLDRAEEFCRDAWDWVRANHPEIVG